MIQYKLKKFLENKPDKKKIIVIYGPTACWKTSLAVDIAKELNSEIISTDSRQIFKDMNIGTAKVTNEEMQWVKHHMIDIISPHEKYSVWEFKKSSKIIMENLYQNKKIPILAWWTWLYIDSLIYDFDIPKIPADWDTRKKLEQEAREFWNDYVYDKLVLIDPLYAKTLHPNNLNYVIRAIEVKMLTWKSKSESIKDKISNYDVLFLTPYLGDREKLYERINLRVDIMFEQWLLKEIEELLKKYKKTDFWMKTIWYEEAIKYIDWEMTLDEAKELIKKNSRNYAKRQLTWFRKYDN
jgi:tRNA dimethylallyltransferase